MKNFKNLGTLLAMSLCMLTIVSCEKADQLTPENAKEAEGLMSTTGDKKFDDLNSETTVYPLLHKSYDKSLSNSEIDALWKEDVKEFLQKNPNINSQKNRSSTQWTFDLSTTTRPSKYNETDGDVRAKVYFNTNKGKYSYTISNLNNPGDDRERGRIDNYFMIVKHVNKAINWVEIESASIGLQGTDGWYFTNYSVTMTANQQEGPASGFSSLRSNGPGKYLDNSWRWGWDNFNTGKIGRGRVRI